MSGLIKVCLSCWICTCSSFSEVPTATFSRPSRTEEEEEELPPLPPPSETVSVSATAAASENRTSADAI